MMVVLRVTLLMLVCGIFAGTVHAEGQSQRYRVNGVGLQVEHVLGTEAERLVSRHLATQPRGPDGEPARWLVRGRWREFSSNDGRTSTVLQVSGGGGALEAIRSTLDVTAVRAPSSAAPLWLPPGALITSQIESLDAAPSQQWFIRSTWTPLALHRWMRVTAGLQGWRIEHQSPGQLGLRRGRTRLVFVAMVAPTGPRIDEYAGSLAVLTQWNQ